MIDFRLYKECGEWRLVISHENITLPTICFNEEVTYEDIITLVPILSKGDITSINVNFTENK